MLQIVYLNLQLQYNKGWSVCPSKCPYLFMSVCPSIYNMYELLLTYCYRTKNLRNYAFVSLFKGIFVVKYKRLYCRIFGRILKMVEYSASYPALPGIQSKRMAAVVTPYFLCIILLHLSIIFKSESFL